MLFLLSIILFISACILGGVILSDAAKQKTELMSMRNLFLAGLIVFQFTSGIIAFTVTDHNNPYAISDKTGPGIKYTIMLLLFTLGYMLIYRSGVVSNQIVKRINRKQVYVTWPKLCMLAISFFFLGVFCRLVLVYVPYFGIYLYLFGASFFALATGLAAWAWVPRLWNPIPMFVAGFVVLGGLGVLFTDSFGRRDMLGIVVAFVWGAYYSTWRYMNYKKLVLRFGTTVTIGVIFLAAFTSTRHEFGIGVESLSTRVTALAQADLLQGVMDLFSGQGAAADSLYFIDTRPEPFEYDTLHSVKLFLVLPIPRSMWMEKPDALGITSVQEIDHSDKPPGWNIGPGLVGHFANDNPFLALPLYTIILAIAFSFADGLLNKFTYDPFIVLPMGVALGQVIAIPRGELGNFCATTSLYIFGGWVMMQVVARVLQFVSPGSSMYIDDTGSDGNWGDEDQSWQDSGYQDYSDDQTHESAYES